MSSDGSLKQIEIKKNGKFEGLVPGDSELDESPASHQPPEDDSRIEFRRWSSRRPVIPRRRRRRRRRRWRRLRTFSRPPRESSGTKPEIIVGALTLIDQNLIGFGCTLESKRGFIPGIIGGVRVLIWVEFEGGFAEGFLDLLLVGTAIQP